MTSLLIKYLMIDYYVIIFDNISSECSWLVVKHVEKQRKSNVEFLYKERVNQSKNLKVF